MEFVARSYLTAGIVAGIAATGIVTAGIATIGIATVPSSSTQLRNIQLTTSAGMPAGLSDQQLTFNSSLIENFLAHNANLVAAQGARIPDLTEALAGADGNAHIAKTAVEQFFDANNALTGAGQAGLLGFLGARGTVDGTGTFTALDPSALNESVIVDPRHVEMIPYAGLQSAIGHYFGAAFFYSMIHSGLSGKEVEGGTTGANFTTLVDSLTEFNSALTQAEHDFSTDLVGDEIALEKALFGTDNAFNGAVNHAFNAFNMGFDAKQQGLNGLLGITGYNPQDYTAALLTEGQAGGATDSGADNAGSVGGLAGMFGQQLMALGAAASATGSGSPDGFTADPAEISQALGALLSTVTGGPFGDTFAGGGSFSVLLDDLHTLLTQLS